MPTTVSQPAYSVALVGNPNTGKSTLFSALVGVHQRVGNYPGVTVEKRVGRVQMAGRRYQVIDLPGLYSLSPRSCDEMVAVDVLLGRDGAAPVDAVIMLVDACNLHRGLYLVSQVLQLGVPVVLAVNMIDLARRQGLDVDWQGLQQRLGIPVVLTQANRRIGLEELREALGQACQSRPPSMHIPYAPAFLEEVARLESLLGQTPLASGYRLNRYLIERLLLDVTGYLEGALLAKADASVREHLRQARHRLSEAGCAVPGVETTARHAWACRILDGLVRQPARPRASATDRLDRVLTHPVWGTLIFALAMLGMFQAVFAWAQPLIGAIDWAMYGIRQGLEAHVPPGAFRSLLSEGVLGGVGNVLAFLPQILILFLFIGVLEDCGYMARAAALMDRLMVRVGLSGKSFIPMLSCFACAVPGMMAARVIENERDRLTTILVAPLMTCSARLPVYALLIAVFIPGETYCYGLLSLRGLTLVAMYVLGILAAVVVALLLKRTLLRSAIPLFLLELPSYKWPSLRTVVLRVAERGWVFVRCAGTLILAVSVLAWAALYFPHDPEVVEAPYQARRQALQAQLAQTPPGQPAHRHLQQQLAELEAEIRAAYQRQSYLGRFGRLVEPVFVPLGWDWRIGSAVIGSFPAREVVVAMLGVMYPADTAPGDAPHHEASRLGRALRAATWDGTNRPVFTVPVALSLMVFYALCAQCAATLAVIRRETNSWRWPIFTFAYMTAMAYVGALLTYQVGTWLAGL